MKKKLLMGFSLMGLLLPCVVAAMSGEDGPAIRVQFMPNGGVRVQVGSGLISALVGRWLALQQERKTEQERARRNTQADDNSAIRAMMAFVRQWERDCSQEAGEPDSSVNGACPDEGEQYDDGQSGFSPVINIKTKFSDVGGAHAAKDELRQIVDFLKNPKKYQNMGADVSKGVLLFGAPGNGKTLLARAVAGEAGVPFISVCASEFEEKLVGVGAERIRALFATARHCARKKGACIVFIDEFDSLATKRDGNLGHDNAQTLNQLLSELDGFAKSKAPVIVLAATNRLDRLDPAAIRPGRFDHHVEVPQPDLISRKEILQALLKRIKVADAIDVDLLARATPGFSGAELAQFVNEAALRAVEEHHDWVTMQDFDAARDKIVMGHANKTLRQDPDGLKKTAYHEAGHALVTLLMPELTDPLYKVTIEPYDAALGLTAYLPDGDRVTYSKDELMARVMCALGGRVGEELGTGKQFIGVSCDLEQATGIARQMVCKYGMSDLGLVSIPDGKSNEKIDAEVQKIIADCYAKTKELITANRDKLEKLAAELLKRKTMTAAEIYELLGIPARTISKI